MISKTAVVGAVTVGFRSIGTSNSNAHDKKDQVDFRDQTDHKAADSSPGKHRRRVGSNSFRSRVRTTLGSFVHSSTQDEDSDADGDDDDDDDESQLPEPATGLHQVSG